MASRHYISLACETTQQEASGNSGNVGCCPQALHHGLNGNISCLLVTSGDTTRTFANFCWVPKDVVQVLCNFDADLQKRDVFGAMPVHGLDISVTPDGKNWNDSFGHRPFHQDVPSHRFSTSRCFNRSQVSMAAYHGRHAIVPLVRAFGISSQISVGRWCHVCVCAHIRPNGEYVSLDEPHC